MINWSWPTTINMGRRQSHLTRSSRRWVRILMGLLHQITIDFIWNRWFFYTFQPVLCRVVFALDKKWTTDLLNFFFSYCGKEEVMASIKEEGTRGKRLSYKIRVCLGRDENGRQVSKAMRWSLPDESNLDEHDCHAEQNLCGAAFHCGRSSAVPDEVRERAAGQQGEPYGFLSPKVS